MQKQAADILPTRHIGLGELVAVDGSFIDSVLSMTWAEYQTQSNKAKLHLGFDLTHGIPKSLILTEGNGAERPQVSSLVQPGQTAVLDRGYQDHERFDQWREDGRHFICRIKENTHRTTLEELPLAGGSPASFDAKVILGVPSGRQTKTPVRVVGFESGGVHYLIATDRFDLTAEQVMLAYKLRWHIETFFGWWKKYLHVYHLFARSKNGMLVQILSGLITYICCWRSTATKTIVSGCPSAECGNSATKSRTRPASSSAPIRWDHAAKRSGNEGRSGKYMQFPNRTMLVRRTNYNPQKSWLNNRPAN